MSRIRALIKELSLKLNIDNADMHMRRDLMDLYYIEAGLNKIEQEYQEEIASCPDAQALLKELDYILHKDKSVFLFKMLHDQMKNFK